MFVQKCGSIVIDEGKHTVTVNDKLISLTLKEYELLKLLAENTGQVFTRDILLASVWGADFVGETRTVDVHIGTLRTKLASVFRCCEGIACRSSECQLIRKIIEKMQTVHLRFSFPQSHSLSRTLTSECPRSVREYSTLGGI